MDSDNNLAYNLLSRMRRLRLEMDNSYSLFALYAGVIDIEKGTVVSPDELDYRNINLEESVRHSIRALCNSRALEELIGLTREIYGNFPELSVIEKGVKNVIQNTELLNNWFIDKYSSLKRRSNKEIV